MSKDTTNGGGGKTADDKDEVEEFTMIEVDDKGQPINARQEPPEDDDPDVDDDDPDETDLEAEDEADRAVDERLGHSEDDETQEEKRERRRREHKAKRIRNRVAAEAKDRLIENQGRMLLNLSEQVAQLQGRTVQYDVNLLQTTLTAIEQQQADAKVVLAKLSKAGDHEGIAEIVDLQMNLRDQHRQTTEQLRRAKSQSKGPGKGQGGRANGADDAETGEEGGETRQPSQPRRPQAPDPEVVRRAQGWAAKHKWADPRTGDPEESEIVKAIDHNLSREGWDPKSDDYWKELSTRVKRRLPHRFKKAAPNGAGGNNGGTRVNGDDTGGKRPAQGGPRMAAASQSGGGSRPLGKNEVRVTPARKQAMMDAGMWDDPAKRNRMLSQYAKYDRENAGQQ